jgi:hypothetical protein
LALVKQLLVLAILLVPARGAAQKTDTRFAHPLVSFVVPAGWTEQRKPANAQADLVGVWFSMTDTAGLYVNAVAAAEDAATVLRRGRGMVIVTLDGAIPSERIDTLQTAAGATLLRQRFTGTRAVGGVTQLFTVLLGATADGERSVMVRAVFPMRHARQVEPAFDAVVRSLR